MPHIILALLCTLSAVTVHAADPVSATRPASATATAGASAAAPATPYAAIQDMIRLLEAGEHERFITSYVEPEQLKDELNETNIADMGKRFSNNKAESVLMGLKSVTSEMAAIEADQLEIDIRFPVEPYNIVMKCIAGRWYLVN